MKGTFVGMTESALLALRDSARASAATGASITSFSGPGVSGSRQINMKPEDILLEVLFALQKLDPDTYGRNLTTSRTVARFS